MPKKKNMKDLSTFLLNENVEKLPSESKLRKASKEMFDCVVRWKDTGCNVWDTDLFPIMRTKEMKLITTTATNNLFATAREAISEGYTILNLDIPRGNKYDSKFNIIRVENGYWHVISVIFNTSEDGSIKSVRYHKYPDSDKPFYPEALTLASDRASNAPATREFFDEAVKLFGIKLR